MKRHILVFLPPTPATFSKIYDGDDVFTLKGTTTGTKLNSVSVLIIFA